MSSVNKIAITAVVVTVIAIGVRGCARALCQHRADYPGDVVFVGHADGIFGAQYWRVYMWRPPDDTKPLPDVTVHLDGQPYRLTELTAELMAERGGIVPQGNLYDAERNAFGYRFENGRLTWFSLDADLRRFGSDSVSNPQAQTIYLSFGQGSQFKLPISDRDLVRYCGAPQSRYLHFAQ